ncbi:sugar nucleotide-binding protein [Vogesella sp. GCM10023246]|uniref:sugar nucleotide-binding protein n=1 Tax=Vogesella TaxID=57739 RepID=UPI003607A6E9
MNHAIFRTSWTFCAHSGSFLKAILPFTSKRDALQHRSRLGLCTDTGHLAGGCNSIGATLVSIQSVPQEAFISSVGPGVRWFNHPRVLTQLAGANEMPLKLSYLNIAPLHLLPPPPSSFHPSNSRLDFSRVREIFDIQLPSKQDDVQHVLSQLCQR